MRGASRSGPTVAEAIASIDAVIVRGMGCPATPSMRRTAMIRHERRVCAISKRKHVLHRPAVGIGPKNVACDGGVLLGFVPNSVEFRWR